MRALDKIIRLAVGDDGGPWLPYADYEAPKGTGSIGGTWFEIQHVIYKHPKGSFHGRKAWRVSRLAEHSTYGSRPSTRIFAKDPNGKYEMGGVRGNWIDPSSAAYAANHCPDCGVASSGGGNLVKGTYDPDVSCNLKCISATGHDCECQCGGTNHGMGWG